MMQGGSRMNAIGTTFLALYDLHIERAICPALKPRTESKPNPRKRSKPETERSLGK
jgi:hypothetical protein